MSDYMCSECDTANGHQSWCQSGKRKPSDRNCAMCNIVTKWEVEQRYGNARYGTNWNVIAEDIETKWKAKALAKKHRKIFGHRYRVVRVETPTGPVTRTVEK